MKRCNARDVRARFEHHVYREPMCGCWLWIGQFSTDGYGYIVVDKRRRSTHRFSWELNRGPIPTGLWVLHRCDVQECCNPDHLFLGTMLDNNLDCKAKGRTALGERNASAKLTAVDIPVIRARLAGGETACRIAIDFGVSDATICDAKLGRTWRHV